MLYRLKKRIVISASHSLNLSYESKCRKTHGHNWVVWVYCESRELDESGMIVDFTVIKRLIHDKLDHQNLNEVLDFNPTAENLAEWICNQIQSCYRVDVQESEGNIATCIADEVIR